jgi:hypothetical protein
MAMKFRDLTATYLAVPAPVLCPEHAFGYPGQANPPEMILTAYIYYEAANTYRPHMGFVWAYARLQSMWHTGVCSEAWRGTP